MLLHNAPMMQIYFGNAQDKLDPDDYLHRDYSTPIITQKPFDQMQKVMRLQQLVFLNQKHSTHGEVITKETSPIVPFGTEGDYLITNVPLTGIGVMSGDCLPIIIYDKQRQVVAIIHAGWRGSVAGIVPTVIERMKQQFSSDPATLQVFFGPSVKVCCYVVSDDFVEQLEEFPYAQEVLHRQEDGLHFDLPAFNRLQLEALGVKKDEIREQYNACTICDTTFCSWRRQGENAGRQMTVVTLK